MTDDALEALEALVALDDAAACVRDAAGAIVWASAAYHALSEASAGMIVQTRAIVWRGGPATLVRVRRDDRAEREAEIAARREAEERLSFLADNLPHAMIYQVSVSPKLERSITYVSRGVEHLHGVTQDQVYADPMILRRQIHADDLPEVTQREQTSWRERTPFSAEVRLVMPTGEIRWALLTSKLRPGPDGAVLWDGMEIDLTDIRRAELARRRADERMRRIFEVFPEPVAVTIDGTVVEINRGFERFFGWRRDEIVGRAATELGLWADLADRARLVARFAVEERVEGEEVSVRRRDGTIATGLVSLDAIELDGQAGILFLFRDYTAQVRAREALAASEARLRSLTEATFEGIGINDNGVIRDVNTQLATMLGYTREELIGKPVASIIAPESRTGARTVMPTAEGPNEEIALKKDGTRLPMELRGRMFELEGRRVRMIAARDISDRKRAELEEARLMAELRAKNSELEQFVYTVSHDLKSPLITIRGFVGAIRDTLEHDGDRQLALADLARVDAAGKRMLALLEDLLDLSRVGRVSEVLRTVALDDLVAEVLETVRGAIAARGVVVEVAPGMPSVRGDRMRLSQVVQNLVENAVKYLGTQPEPRVAIAAHADPATATVTLTVRDNGIGIPAVHHERVFGLFDKLDPKSPGTGVGLALVRRIVEYHGGRVWVESAGAGAGSTFHVRLPAP